MTVNNEPIEIKVDNRPVEIQVNNQPVNIEVSGARGPAGAGVSARKIYGAKFSRSGGREFVGSFTFLGELKNTTQEEFYMEMSSDGLTWKLLCATNPLIFNSNILHITLVEFPFGFATGFVYGQYANALTGNIYNSTFILTVEFIESDQSLELNNLP